MVASLIGVGASLASNLIPNMKVWILTNLDTGEELQGQFEPEGLTKEVNSTWGEFTSLNRQNPIMQFLQGQSDQIAFTARLFRNHSLDDSPKDKLEKLESWIRIDSSVRRPPILQLSVGDGHINMNCVITGLSQKYGRPDFFGGLRDISVDISLKQFVTFSLDDEQQTDTRYARVKEREYYELLAYQEYGNPLLGDIIRKNHPQYQRLQPGNIVKLPSIEGIRNQEVKQTSVPLKTAFGKKNTPQKQLRIRFFESRSESYTSHLLQ